jgi:hypothetical protein
MPITQAQLAEWRAQLSDDGDDLDPMLAQLIAPKLIEEVERLQAELAYVCRKLAAQEVGGARRPGSPARESQWSDVLHDAIGARSRSR